jgi:hypothetical protein
MVPEWLKILFFTALLVGGTWFATQQLNKSSASGGGFITTTTTAAAVEVTAPTNALATKWCTSSDAPIESSIITRGDDLWEYDHLNDCLHKQQRRWDTWHQ